MAASVPTTGPGVPVRSNHRRGPQSAQAIGLGVEAPVGGVVVLGRAGLAQREVRHGRVGPVVGQGRVIVKRGPQLVQLMNG